MSDRPTRAELHGAAEDERSRLDALRRHEQHVRLREIAAERARLCAGVLLEPDPTNFAEGCVI